MPGIRTGIPGRFGRFGQRLVQAALCAACMVAAVPALAAPAVAAAPVVQATAESDIYAIEPQPLTAVQCAQCHPRQFGDLKQGGGKHRFACQDCHEVFHAYNPLRNNYAQLMPKCSGCHDAPHGPAATDCLTCHSNPHTPRQVIASDQLGKRCGECHAPQAAEIKEFPSAHGELGCQACHHDRHGYKPQCFECHQPHFPEQPVAACTTCHPVHKPLKTVFTATDNPATCAACHGDVFNKWRSSKAKHSQLNCTSCHKEHGQIPNCRDCHTPPHDEKLLQMFPKCLACHLDVHNMPVKNKAK